MEKFYYEVPGIDRKEDAIAYINEFYQYKSNINGSGKLHKYLDNYQGWLEQLQIEYMREANERIVPSKTFFLVRSSDSKIVGMINIRLALNERLKKSGGNIGYSIKPTERGKGYNKINLYLCLKVCQEYKIEKILLDADKDNPASWRTMEALGGINIKESYDEEEACIAKRYEIDVKESIAKYSSIYEPMVEDIRENKEK